MGISQALVFNIATLSVQLFKFPHGRMNRLLSQNIYSYALCLHISLSKLFRKRSSSNSSAQSRRVRPICRSFAQKKRLRQLA